MYVVIFGVSTYHPFVDVTRYCGVWYALLDSDVDVRNIGEHVEDAGTRRRKLGFGVDTAD